MCFWWTCGVPPPGPALVTYDAVNNYFIFIALI